MISSRRSHHWLRLLVGVLILLAAHLLLRGYVTDDTYIHLRYAQNLADRQEFAFNPGEDTYGATSPLWIFGLVLLLKLGVNGPTATWILGLFSGALTLVLMAGLLRRIPFPESWRWWLFLLTAVDAWFLRWTMSGMETPLATAALLALLWPLVMPTPVNDSDERRRPLWHRYLGWGVAAGLAGLVRPEYLLLAPAAVPWLLLFEYRRASLLLGAPGRVRARPHGPFLAALGGWLVSVGPWLVYAQVTFGRWTPGTATAKSSAASFAPLEIVGYLWRSIEQLGMTQGSLWAFFGALVILVLVERFRQEHDDDPEEDIETVHRESDWQFWQAVALVLVAVTWTGLLLGGYAVKKVWTISRYLSPLSPVILLMIAVLAYWLLNFATGFRGRPVMGRWVAVTACVVCLLSNLLITVVLVRPHAQEFSAGVVECYLEKGEWIGEHSEPDDVIAALDIGALAYGSDRRVLDLMGLVSPEIMALGREVGFQQMVESGAWLRAGDASQPPAWFVDRWVGTARWDGRTIHGVTFELLDTCVIKGVGLREPEDWLVAIYRLNPAD